MAIRNSVYGLHCSTRQQNTTALCLGTGFMIAPEVIISVAHVLHVGNNCANDLHETIRVCRDPDIGTQITNAILINENPIRDIALLRLTTPPSDQSVSLVENILAQGTSCGSLGFPLASTDTNGWYLNLRFQGAHISAFEQIAISGTLLDFYVTDSLMYKGSSGSPGFTVDGEVFGLYCKSQRDPPPPDNPTRPESDRYAFSFWIPSTEIKTFAEANGVNFDE